MGRRFEYRKLTKKEFREALARIDMPLLAFARIFGPDERRVRLWLNGQEDIPTWCRPVLRMLENVPGAIPEARQAAAEMIVRDNAHPERGEFPYLEPEGGDDEQN